MPTFEDPSAFKRRAIFSRSIALFFFFIGAIFTAPDDALAQAKPRHSFSGPINCLQYFKGGQLTIVADQNEVHQIDRNGETLKSVKLPLRQITSLALSKDEKNCYIGGGDPGIDGQVVILNLYDFAVLEKIKLHRDVITSLAISEGPLRLITSSIDQEISVYDLNEKTIHKLSDHTKAVTGVTWLDETLAVSTAEDMSVRVWDASQATLARSMNQHSASVLGVIRLMGAESELDVVATWGKDRTVRFWQPTIGRMLRFSTLHGVPTAATWNRSKALLIVGDDSGSVHWINWKSAKIIRSKKFCDDWITALAIDESTQQILVGTSAGDVFQWQ